LQTTKKKNHGAKKSEHQQPMAVRGRKPFSKNQKNAWGQKKKPSKGRARGRGHLKKMGGDEPIKPHTAKRVKIKNNQGTKKIWGEKRGAP